jgi:hypothetical protein
MAPRAQLDDDGIARYLWEAAQAGVDRETVLSVIRLWAENGTGPEVVAQALDTVEASEIKLHVRLTDYLAALRDLLELPDAIDLTIPQQRSARAAG